MGERREKTREEWRVNNRRGDWGKGALHASFHVSPPLSERLEQAIARGVLPEIFGGGVPSTS